MRINEHETYDDDITMKEKVWATVDPYKWCYEKLVYAFCDPFFPMRDLWIWGMTPEKKRTNQIIFLYTFSPMAIQFHFTLFMRIIYRPLRFKYVFKKA